MNAGTQSQGSSDNVIVTQSISLNAVSSNFHFYENGVWRSAETKSEQRENRSEIRFIVPANDVTGDGLDDYVVVTDNAIRTISLNSIPSSTNPTFVLSQPHQFTYPPATLDFDGDGTREILYTSLDEVNNQSRIGIFDVAENEQIYSDIDQSGNPAVLVYNLGDVNNDGFEDALVAYQSLETFILFGASENDNIRRAPFPYPVSNIVDLGVYGETELFALWSHNSFESQNIIRIISITDESSISVIANIDLADDQYVDLFSGWTMGAANLNGDGVKDLIVAPIQQPGNGVGRQNIMFFEGGLTMDGEADGITPYPDLDFNLAFIDPINRVEGEFLSFADLNNDGIDELVFLHKLFRNSGATENRIYTLFGNKFISQIDMQAGFFSYAPDNISSFGNQFSVWNQVPRSPVGDFDGDGVVEVIFSQQDKTYTSDPIYSLTFSVDPFFLTSKDQFELLSNFPNPFNPTTTIQFVLQAPAQVQLEVFDIMGRRIQTLRNGFMSNGLYNVEFDASDLASGVYYTRLNVNGIISTRTMTLTK